MTSVRRAHTPRRGRRLLLPIVVTTVAVGAVALSACTPDRERPATVTLPEHGTTTSTIPSTLAPGGGASSTEQDQPPQLAWAVQVGGAGDDVLRAVTGSQASVVAVGSTSAGIDTPTSGGTDVLSATVSTSGEVESVDQFGSGGEDEAAGVAATQGSVVACGSTTGTLGLSSGGASDTWCAPLPTLAGDTISQLGATEDERLTGVAMPGDADAAANGPGTTAGYASGIIKGYFPGAEDPAGRGLGEDDALALRVGVDGVPVWARQFGTAGSDAATAVTATGTDGIFVGYTDGDLEGPSKGQRDGWISRIDDTGVQRWITQFGSSGNDELRAVAAAGEARRGNEQFVAVGSTDGDVDGTGPLANSGGTDAIVSAFGSDGAVKWTTQLGSELDDVATAVATDGDTVFVAGTTQTGTAPGASPSATDTLPDGGALPDGTAPSTTVAPGGEVGLGELDPSVGPGGAGDGFLAALDAATGEVRWAIRLGSANDEVVTGLTTTEDGLLVLSGTTTGQIADTAPAGGVDGFLLAFPLPSAGGGAASSV